MNADGTVKTPAVPGTPELVAGPILLGQKFGEFVKSGGITSCTTWINNQINAVAAAGVGGVATVAAGLALIPK
jgi:hypothetical protein